MAGFFLVLLSGLCFVYWKDRNVKESATIDKKEINGIVVAGIISSLVVQGVLTKLQAEELDGASLQEIENYLLANGLFSKEGWSNWCLYSIDGVNDYTVDLDGDMNLTF